MMMMMLSTSNLLFFLIFTIMIASSSFTVMAFIRTTNTNPNSSAKRQRQQQVVRNMSEDGVARPPKKYYGGAGVGRLVLDDKAASSQSLKCKYDMVLVERIQGKAKKESGLFVPQEDLPKLHLCQVISMGPGREEENGTIQPMPDIRPGDLVIAKNPWGIGPKDEETADGKKLSFMRAQDIAAVICGTLVDEEQ